MATPLPIARVRLEGRDLVPFAGAPVLGQFDTLDRGLARYGLHGFLARPHQATDPDGMRVVAYESDRPATPLDPATPALAAKMRALDAAVLDPEIGLALRHALVTAGALDLRGDPDQPVLAGWGLVEHRHGTGPGGLAAGLREGFGRHHGPFSVADAVFFSQLAPTTITRRPAWMLPVLAGILVGLIAAGVLWALRPAVPVARADTVRSETILGLQDELSRLRRAAAAPNVCVADPAILPRPSTAPMSPAAIPDPPVGRPKFSGTLDTLLGKSVVMVISRGPQSVGWGTGFFVAPNLVVTNSHVVAGATGPIFVLQQEGKRGLPAKIRKMTKRPPTDGTIEPDFALLEVQAAPGAETLALSRSVMRRDPVEAAGFPALVVKTDGQMQSILDGGQLDRSPEMVLTEGTVSAVQATADQLKLLPHTAQISSGNSGGPLLDACGRVVGINTFLRSDKTSATVSFALKVDGLIDFLGDTGVAITIRDEACAIPPPVAAAAPPGPTPASTPPSALPSPPAPGAGPSGGAAAPPPKPRRRRRVPTARSISS